MLVSGSEHAEVIALAGASYVLYIMEVVPAAYQNLRATHLAATSRNLWKHPAFRVHSLYLAPFEKVARSVTS